LIGVSLIGVFFIGVSLIGVSLIGVSLIVSRIDVSVICKGYFRQSNVVCRVGGFTTNSKPIVKMFASPRKNSLFFFCMVRVAGVLSV
jgi:hypothetical protein